MRSPRRYSMRRLAAANAIGLGCLLLSGPAWGQFNGTPFDPFRAAYRSSSLPTMNQFAPGQVRTVTPPGLGTVPGIGKPWDATYTIPPLGVSGSRFDRLEQELFGPLGDAYRPDDAGFGRLYRPRAEEDERFDQAQEMRRELYLQATRETDPQRKAELLRRYRDVSRRISLGLSPSASRGSQNARAERADTSANRRGADVGAAAGLPATVRSYDDLMRWSRVINQRAIQAGISRPEAN